MKKGLILLLSLVLLSSCEKKMIKDNAGVNKWVHTTMKDRYLWSGTLGDYVPSDIYPPNYFEQLRYRRDQGVSLYYDIYGDRFSRISFNGSASRSVDEYSLSSEDRMVNFGFGYLKEQENLVVTYVVPHSPADVAGLERGDVIYDLRTEWGAYGLEYLEYENKVELYCDYPENKTVRLSKAVFYDTPVIFDSVYNTSAGKTGYLVYNHFTAGSNNKFNNELKGVIAEFKREGVENLVLDLRYNGGGELNTAVMLASMLARPEDRGHLFLYFERNRHVGQPYYKFELRHFLTVDELGGEQYCLDLDKIVILTTGASASASELIIHGLKPFFGDNLTQIGAKTFGKNLGTVAISNKLYEWNISITSLRVYDKNGDSGYEKGISADIFKGDGKIGRPGAPYDYCLGNFGIIEGDGCENMLREAISYLEGESEPSGRSSLSQEAAFSQSQYHGIRHRELIEDEIVVY